MAKIKNFTLEGDALVLVGYLDEQRKPTFAVDFKSGLKVENMSRGELDTFKLALIHDAYDVLLDSMVDRFLREWGEEPMPGAAP